CGLSPDPCPLVDTSPLGDSAGRLVGCVRPRRFAGRRSPGLRVDHFPPPLLMLSISGCSRTRRATPRSVPRLFRKDRRPLLRVPLRVAHAVLAQSTAPVSESGQAISQITRFL